MALALRTICALTLLWGAWINQAGAVASLDQPNWAKLNEQQRQALAPLKGEWDGMEPYRRKKWLGIADRYHAMSPDEQERVQRRMKDWAKLAPEERKQARDKYKTLQKVPADQRESLRQNWEDYKALPDEEKKRLQNQAVRRPPVSTLPPPPSPTQIGKPPTSKTNTTGKQ
jgi:hypothetical protein